MRQPRVICFLAAAVLCAVATSELAAQETLKVAVGQRTLWDTSVSELGQRGGIFKKHGLALDILYTQGSGETQQAVIAGSVDIGVGVGVMGVLSADSKGGPGRSVRADVHGAGHRVW